MKRTHRIAALLVVLGLLVAACSKEEGFGEEVRKEIDATLEQPHRFVFTQTTPDGTVTTVQGLVEDDFRYQALLGVDDQAVLERVVDDDLVSVRLYEPDRLGDFIDKDVVSYVDRETSLDGIDVFQALQSRNWVSDPGGAPPLLVASENQTDTGLDPIEDARRFLSRARDFTLREGSFVKYSPDSISPTYRRDEDPFPAPEEGSAVTRYDLRQPEFPRGIEGGQPYVPGEAEFRKLAVYVKDGLVIRVSEEIGLAPTVLKRFETFMTALVNQTAPPQIRESFATNTENLEGDELGRFLLDSLNTIRSITGDPAIEFRTSTYELLDLGDSSIHVESPADAIEANLAVLLSLGVKPIVTEDDQADDGDAADAASTDGESTDGGSTDAGSTETTATGPTEAGST